jgi:arginase
MPLDLIQVPYDSAHRGVRMGAGPLAFGEAGAAARLRAGGREVREVVIEARRDFRAEPATAFELDRALALAVRAAVGRGSFPLVLAGNCITSVGTLAGLGTGGTGVVWLDAHADLNTPETTSSGFLDGMSLAVATGRCWTGVAASVADFAPVPDERVVLVGARDLDPPEARLLEVSGIARVGVEAVRASGAGEALASALAGLRAHGAERVYLHVDLDVHDPDDAGPANGYAFPGGLRAEEVRDVVRAVAERLPIAAAALTAYDPSVDADGRMRETGLALIDLLAELGTHG